MNTRKNKARSLPDTLDSKKKLSLFFHEVSTIHQLSLETDLSPFISLCLDLMNKAETEFDANGQKCASELLRESVKTIQHLLILNYDRSIPNEKVLQGLQTLETEIQSMLQTAIPITLKPRAPTRSRRTVNARPQQPMSKSAEEFRGFLISPQNNRPALPFFPAAVQNQKVAGVRVVHQPAETPFQAEPPQPDALKSSFSSFFVNKLRKIDPKVYLYLFVTYVFASLWLMMSYKADLELALHKNHTSEEQSLGVATPKSILAPRAAHGSSNSIAQSQNPPFSSSFPIQSGPPQILNPEIKIAGADIQMNENQIKVHLEMRKPQATGHKIKGTFVLLSRGPLGIYSSPEGAVDLTAGQPRIIPQSGTSFSFGTMRVVDEMVKFAGSNQVEIFVFGKTGQLIGYELMKVPTLK